MNKFYFLALFAFIGLTGKAQNISFPDATFKSVLLSSSPSNHIAKNLAGNYFKIDSNNDGEIQISEALQVGGLSFINTTVTSIVGIGYFSNLTSLGCNQNDITAVDVSGLANLTMLDCSSNGTVASINVNGCNALQNLSCNTNLITTLDLSGLSQLNYLNCQNNLLTELNLSGLSAISSLYTGGNQLTSLDVTDLSNLYLFGFNGNPLVTLFIKNNKSEILLDFAQTPTLRYICADDAEIASVQTKLTSYGYTNCVVNSYCSFTPGGAFYTIQGHNKFDGNNNGCDALDYVYPNLKFSITNGTITGSILSNTTGFYYIPVQAGTYTITPALENPTYFSVSPTSLPVTFPTAISPNIQDFCITAINGHDDLEVVIVPTTIARPGFDAHYKVLVKNKGTTVQNGTVTMLFNDAIMDYVSSSPVANVNNNSVSWNFSNINPLQTLSFNVNLNINSPMETPAVNAGNVLTYTATVSGAVDEVPADNTITLNQTVVNSHDPNDKTCLEGATVSTAMVGNYVHYIIRFENTGTFAAQNIVVKDIISPTKFDINTLVPLDGSASYVTRITNTNQVEFIFENINLPFDDENNDGYVAFKIKTKPPMAVGSSFTNYASIYFDYNFPVITNTATTTITALSIQDFDFGSMFSLSPVPAKNVLNITNKQNVLISSVSIYNTLGQLIQVTANPNEAIDVSGLKTGSYFIKIISDKGTASSTFIKQ